MVPTVWSTGKHLKCHITLENSRGHLLHRPSFPALTAVAPGGRGMSPRPLRKLEAELGQLI